VGVKTHPKGGVQMAFSAKTFIFNGIPSEFFNLYLGEIDGDGQSTTSLGSDVSLLTEKIFRRPVPYLYGAEQTPMLQFTLSAFFPGAMDVGFFTKISGWLFGQQNYKKLYLCQADMTDVYFNCFLTAPQIVKMGNMITGFTTTVVCDAPWGWKENYVFTQTGLTYGGDQTVTLFNDSDNTFYTKPTATITFDATGGDASIINTSDSNRETEFVGIDGSDVITLNSDIETISGTSGDTDFLNGTKFNYKWLRLVRGHNILTVNGRISSLSLSIPIAVKTS